MNLLIIGASGGTGRELVKQGLEQGHHVTAFVRDPGRLPIKHPNLKLHVGDVLQYPSVEDAVFRKDAVLCALGHKKWFVRTTILSEGTKNIITAMEKFGVKRLICETALGIGDSRGRLGLYYTLFVIPFIVGPYFRDKERQEQRIKESSLDWVVVRPGQLTYGRKRGTFRHGPDIGNYILTVGISRADTADFMLRQLTDDTYLRKTVAVAG